MQKNIGDKKIVCLGDVHGRIDLLEKFLEKFSTNEYFIIQLGDLNDNTMEEVDVSSVSCIEAFMDLHRTGDCEVLYSNHHDKLYRYLNGNPIKPSHGMNRTIEEIEICWDPEYQGIVHKWLSERLMYYEFEIDGLKHVCVHAYMDDLVYSRKDNHKSTREYKWFVSQCIYGPNEDGKRYEWWNDPKIDKKITGFHLICGHYHKTIISERFSILDSDDHSLVAYTPHDREVYIIK